MGRPEEALARSENTTAGPWKAMQGEAGYDVFSISREFPWSMPIACNARITERDAKFIAESCADVPDFARALMAIKKLHKQVGGMCSVCREEWPCPTIEVIDALEGGSDADRD